LEWKRNWTTEKDIIEFVRIERYHTARGDIPDATVIVSQLGDDLGPVLIGFSLDVKYCERFGDGEEEYSVCQVTARAFPENVQLSEC